MDTQWFSLAILGALVLPLFMRGGGYHLDLAHRVASVVTTCGLQAQLEHAHRLPDGRLDFVDVWVTGSGVELIIEIETTPRYAAVNLEKAVLLDQAIWFVVPNRQLRRHLQTRIQQSSDGARVRDGRVLLPDEVHPALKTMLENLSR